MAFVFSKERGGGKKEDGRGGREEKRGGKGNRKGGKQGVIAQKGVIFLLHNFSFLASGQNTKKTSKSWLLRERRYKGKQWVWHHDGVDHGWEISGTLLGVCLCSGKPLSCSEGNWLSVQQSPLLTKYLPSQRVRACFWVAQFYLEWTAGVRMADWGR